MKKILVIKLGALGDIMQAEGAVHDLRLYHPDAEITVMTTPTYEKLWRRCPWIDRIMLDPRDSRFRLDKMLLLRNALRSYGFDQVYDLQQVSRTNFYHYWFLRDTPWLGGASGCSCCVRRPEDRCAAEHFHISFQHAGISTRYCLESNVSWMVDDVDALLESYSLPQGFVALIPGASAEHPEKRWPLYQLLANYFLAKGVRVVTIPGPDELELCQQIGGDMLLWQEKYLDAFKLAGVLLKARYVVGNDTGPTHIAAHLRLPGLALFSSHAPARRSGIQYSRFTWLEQDNLANLSLDQVLKALPPDIFA